MPDVQEPALELDEETLELLGHLAIRMEADSAAIIACAVKLLGEAMDAETVNMKFPDGSTRSLDMREIRDGEN